MRWAAAISCAGLVAGYLLAPLPAIELRLTSSREERSTLLPILDGEKVAVGFQHSLYKVDQVETYGVVQGGLALESVFLGSFDALNYYDPMGELPSRPSGNGYEIRFPARQPRPVSFAMAHHTPVWVRVGGLARLMLSDAGAEFSGFTLRVSHVTRLYLYLLEWRA